MWIFGVVFGKRAERLSLDLRSMLMSAFTNCEIGESSGLLSEMGVLSTRTRMCCNEGEKAAFLSGQKCVRLNSNLRDSTKAMSPIIS